MRRFQDFPIKHKLTLISLLTTTVALVLACASFVAYERLTFKGELEADTAGTAAIIGYNSASALSFNDPQSAEHTLQALTAETHVVAACIYDSEGRVFATYPSGSDPADFGPPPAQASQRYSGGYLELFRPISDFGDNVGTIYIRTDLSAMRARLFRYALIIAAVMVMAILVSYVIASRLQRVISAPVADLVSVASHVAAEKDYSVRAVKRGDDELGRLIDGFNDMLGQIQARDAALQKTSGELEVRVAERTAQLAREQARFKFIFESIPVGISLVASGEALHLVNPAHERITGVTARDSGKSDVFQSVSHPDDYRRQMELAQPFVRGEVDRYSLEKRYLHPDGGVVWVILTSRKFADAVTGVPQSITTLVDITERKEAEAKLANSLSVLHATLEATADGIAVVDRHNRLTTFNKKFAEMWQIPAEVLATREVEKINEVLLRLVKDPEAVADKTQELLLQTDAESFDAIDFKDGRCFERYSQAQQVDGVTVGRVWCIRDVTARKQAEEELSRTHRHVLEISRQAGMAEIATGVLHNVGNVLNSVNVSATLVSEQVRQSKAVNVGKLGALFEQHKADLAHFLTTDARGQMIPAYVATLAEILAEEQKTMVTELDHLRKNVEHIKDIVAMQQSYAGNSGVIETVSVPDLVESALQINAGSLSRHDIDIIREYPVRPVITTDKHKVMQILINLVRNAKFACADSGRADKKIIVRIGSDARGIKISVIDNGVGIPEENLTRIFNHGFTTRKHGHGFGLHSGALAARDIGGSLIARSDGPGLGATFILELPYKPVPASL